MPKKGGSSKKHAVGKTHVKKDNSRKTSTPQTKKGTFQTKSGSKNTVGKLLKGGGCLLPIVSIIFFVIWFTFSLL